MRRAAVAAALAAALATVVFSSAAVAAPGMRIAGSDTQGYPHIVVNVVTAQPVAKPPLLRENGAPVAGLQAVNLGAAKSVVVEIDNSRSMKGAAIADAAAAARAFVDAKAAGDRVSLIAFGRHALQLTGFSTSAAQADGALQGLAVDRRQGTALYDAVVAGANSLRGSSQPGRVIVLLTDGRDVSSLASLDDAVSAARRADAAVYPIGIESSDFDPTALREIAHETGGTYHGAGSTAQLQQVYDSIASELDRTWRLGYETAARPGDRLDLRATSGSRSAVRTVVVPALFGGVGAVPPSRLLPSVVYSPLGTIVISLLVAALLLAAVYSLVRLRRGSWVRQRLAAHVAQTKEREQRSERLSFLKALFTATEGAFGRRSQWRSVERLLVRGDVPLRPAEFVWLVLGCALAGGFLFGVAGAPAMLTLAAFAGGGALPYGFVKLRVRRRLKAFENQLPDLLTTIAASLKAGHSFKHGLQAVVDESQPPASIELKRVLTEAGLGRPLDDALADMAERVGSENFGFAITAATIQRQVGGSLATLFDMVSETVRNRQQFARKIRSLTAMGRMSAYTLIAIPFFIAGVITLTNSEYIAPLFHSHAGHILLFTGLAMMTVGSLILKRSSPSEGEGMLLLIIASACLAGSVFVVGQFVTQPERERRSLVRRAAHYGNVRVPTAHDEGLSLRERVVAPAVSRLAGLVLRLNRRENLEAVQQRLLAAGLSGVSPSSFLAAKGFLAGAGTVFGLALWLSTGSGLGLLFTLVLAAGGYFVPAFLVSSRARRRRDEVQAALPDALDLLAVSVEAGLGFDAAISKLIEHMHGPLIDEFGLALSEMRVGEARQDALKKLSRRVDSPELSAFVRAIIQADQLGISLGRILRVQAVDTRLKRQAVAEEKAQKAPIKMLFPTVLFIFPAMFIVILGPAMITLGKLFNF